MINALKAEIKHLPIAARAEIKNKLLEFIETSNQQSIDLSAYPDFISSVAKVWYCSRFVKDNCLRYPEMLFGLLASADLFTPYQQRTSPLTFIIDKLEDEAALMTALRQFRRREMLRIAWRDLAGWADLNETLTELTELAELCIQSALEFLYTQACHRKGTPLKADGSDMNIVVLGMGKLGAWELNFSSDIDLIFAYAEDGVLNDRKQTTYGEFFSRICRSLVKVLDAITVDGFVFRTDIRLRPFGDSGPIIMTFDGMENYYLTQAREWERYAMIKARQVAGDFISGQQLAAMIQPFIYRRYLDYGAFEELRSLKYQITQELKRKDRLDNIKLGPGGIREIEFIGQAFQLIRGGQDPELQHRSILKILKLLAEKNLLPIEDAEQLQTAYHFLRKTENHIQQYQDQQTHDLPKAPSVQQNLAYSMGYADWSSFKSKLDKIRNNVQQIFEQVFSLSEQEQAKTNAEIVWSNASEEHSLSYLQQHGFLQAEQSLDVIKKFKQSSSISRLSVKGVAVINRLIPKLIDNLQVCHNQDETLKRVLDLFEQVAGRNVYLSLLTENPDALSQLIKLSSASSWICHYLAQYPVLFDELLDTRTLYAPLNKAELSRQLAISLQSTDSADIEQLMIKLREFKHLNVLRVAAADIMDKIEVTVVSDYLTYIAEVLLDQTVKIAWDQLIQKHGLPPGKSQLHHGFAVLGFGKLGGMELGYSSDLDMVFLYDCEDNHAMTLGNKAISCSQFYGRLGQKVRHIIDTKMLSGILYEVDMRLRPSGDSGLLVPHINSYEDYLKNNAWTWEHQALIRGRFISGDNQLKHDFVHIRQRILCLSRDKQTVKNEILQMRNKMRSALDTTNDKQFDLKHGIGGIVDIEFIVQFHILAYAAKNKDLTIYTDIISLIKCLSQHGILSENDAVALKNAYSVYRDYGHHQVLQDKRMLADKNKFLEKRKQIESIWQKFFNIK